MSMAWIWVPPPPPSSRISLPSGDQSNPTPSARIGADLLDSAGGQAQHADRLDDAVRVPSPEGDTRAIGRPDGVVRVRRVRAHRQLTRIRPIGVHDIEVLLIRQPHGRAVEGDPRAIRRPTRIAQVLRTGRLGQRNDVDRTDIEAVGLPRRDRRPTRRGAGRAAGRRQAGERRHGRPTRSWPRGEPARPAREIVQAQLAVALRDEERLAVRRPLNLRGAVEGDRQRRHDGQVGAIRAR